MIAASAPSMSHTNAYSTIPRDSSRHFNERVGMGRMPACVPPPPGPRVKDVSWVAPATKSTICPSEAPMAALTNSARHAGALRATFASRRGINSAFASTQTYASVASFRGVHFTGWAAGSSKARRRFIDGMKSGGFNAVVIALKDYDGRVFVRDVPLAARTGAFTNAIPDLPGAVKDFEDAGIYTIARIAIFKDDHLARARPDLAVHFPDGRIWTNDNGTAWVDPYKKEVWDYAIDIASRAAAAGFDEIVVEGLTEGEMPRAAGTGCPAPTGFSYASRKSAICANPSRSMPTSRKRSGRLSGSSTTSVISVFWAARPPMSSQTTLGRSMIMNCSTL